MDFPKPRNLQLFFAALCMITMASVNFHILARVHVDIAQVHVDIDYPSTAAELHQHKQPPVNPHEPVRKKPFWTKPPVNPHEPVPEKPFWTIMIALNDGYYEMFLNWMFYFERLKLNNEIILIAEDDIVAEKIRKATFSANIALEYSGLDLGTVNRQNGNYEKMMSTRAGHILKRLKENRNIVFTDVDLVWRGNPMPYFNRTEEYDSFFQNDGSGKRCGGFFAMVANERTIKLVSEWDSILVEKPQTNQPVLNKLLQRRNSTVRDTKLDYFKFTNMRHYEKQATKRQRQDTVMLHSNVAHDRKGKIEALKKWGLWFNESNMMKTTL
jgi:hypothetical protein